ncbi:MAG: 2-hydroxyglutaryl-CoA dehydratase [Deltaproteobacteria bacterium]|nr:2-hydroxyglutaryl-CoA dehydratase [Deltaproteobacteria bacterium]
MIVAGCDVGSLTAKVVIMDDISILAASVIKAKSRPEESAKEVMDMALKEAGLCLDAIEYRVGTGYGRKQIPFANEVVSEIACHGKGGHWLIPSVRTIVDIGGQDAKAIKVDENGNVIRYVYNDKCASGTGRFLEIMADAMEIRLEDMGKISLGSNSPVSISNQCTVFAETEVISLVNDGKEIPDIVSGLHRAMAHRVAALAKSIEIEADVTLAGGVAKNIGMYAALEDALGVKIKKMNLDPQINGALGAALLAQEALRKKTAA